MRTHADQCHLPHPLRSYGPGPRRWGWVITIDAPEPAQVWAIGREIERMAWERHWALNNHLLIDTNARDWWGHSRRVWVGVANDRAFAPIKDAILERWPQAVLRVTDTWWT